MTKPDWRHEFIQETIDEVYRDGSRALCLFSAGFGIIIGTLLCFCILPQALAVLGMAVAMAVNMAALWFFCMAQGGAQYLSENIDELLDELERNARD